MLPSCQTDTKVPLSTERIISHINSKCDPLNNVNMLTLLLLLCSYTKATQLWHSNYELLITTIRGQTQDLLLP